MVRQFWFHQIGVAMIKPRIVMRNDFWYVLPIGGWQIIGRTVLMRFQYAQDWCAKQNDKIAVEMQRQKNIRDICKSVAHLT
jgi:hypothetical protein